jgi:hypothetical protein
MKNTNKNEKETSLEELLNQLDKNIDDENNILNCKISEFINNDNNNATINDVLKNYLEPIRNKQEKLKKSIKDKIKTRGGYAKCKNFIVQTKAQESYDIDEIIKLLRISYNSGGLKDLIDENIFKKTITDTQIRDYLKNRYKDDEVRMIIMKKLDKCRSEDIDLKVIFLNK